MEMCASGVELPEAGAASYSHETRGHSWSGEYIYVDFRAWRGKIHSKHFAVQDPVLHHHVQVTPPFMAPITMVTYMHMLPKMCLNSNLSCHFLIIVLIVFSGSTMFILTTYKSSTANGVWEWSLSSSHSHTITTINWP